MFQLSDHPWTLLLTRQEFEMWVDKIHTQNKLVLLPDSVEVPTSFPCVAKCVILGHQPFAIYFTEEEAIEFLRKVHTRQGDDQPLPTTQDEWNRQVSALLMALVRVLLDNRLCSKEKFEILDAQFRVLVDEEVTKRKDEQGSCWQSAAFLRQLLGLP